MCSYVFIREWTSSNNVAHFPPPPFSPPSLHLLLDCSWRWNTQVQRARRAVVARVTQSSALWELRVLSPCRRCGTLPLVRMHDYIVYVIVAYIVSVFGSTTTEYHIIIIIIIISVTCKSPLLYSPGKWNNQKTWATNMNIKTWTHLNCSTELPNCSCPTASLISLQTCILALVPLRVTMSYILYIIF